jgi:molybdopterin-containing oxidoreductase family molybdopterin binding subunit
MSEESFVYTACPGWGDHDYCALKTIVKDGKIIRAEKTVYPNQKLAKGHICQKGLESISQPYNKDRLLYPQKRAGKRGEGKWERISWDQAMDEIASKLLAIRKQYGAEALSFWNFIAGVPPMFGVGQLLASRFMSLWGATDPLQSYGLDNGPMFAALYTFNNQFGSMSIDPRNFEGSDPYLALAMARYIIEQDLYKKEYVVQKTVAAYLVDEDTGMLALDADGNYLVWDAEKNAAAPVAPEGGELPTAAPALFGSFEVQGSSCKPAFQKLVEHLDAYTLESAERITGVPAAKIIKLCQEYCAASKPYLMSALGLRYQNQGESYRAFYLLGALSGTIGMQGAGVTTSLGCSAAPVIFNNAGIARAEGVESKTKFVRQKDFFEQIQSGDPYPIKAMFITSGNPAHNCPNRDRWIKAFDAMELVVDIDIWMTDTGELADYVLPDCMPFERTEILDMAAWGHIVLQEPAIEPQGEAKDMTYYFTELAKRVGLGQYFDKTVEEWLDVKLQTDFEPIATLQPPVTLERLKKEKIVAVNWPSEPPFDPMLGLEPVTKTGRIEFYAERLLGVGLEFPTYFAPLESPVIDSNNQEFPYQFFTGRQRFFMQSMFTDDPVMIELSGKEPSARINPQDAAKEGIIDGEKVEVYNDRGHVVASMRLDEAVPPGTIQVWFGWRQRQFEQGTYAELLIPLGDKCTTNATSEVWYNEAKTVYGEDDMGLAFATGYAGGWDTIWDCACAVRKLTDGKAV